MFGYDTVWNYFCDDIGKILYTDHSVLSFWSTAKQVFGYTDFITKQRCFGTKNAHRYLLDYTNQFVRNYSKHNKFGYIHISVAHEDSNTVYTTVDLDMKEFLEEFFDFYSRNDEDFVLMIAGDHGKGVKGAENMNEQIYEIAKPLHLLITKQDFIKKIGIRTHKILQENTERLVSRLDWYVTLKHLAVLPYGNMEVYSESYKKLKNDSASSHAVSLFLEKVPDNRSCDDMKITKIYCFCD